jgi:tellurite methyltransferase
VIEADMSIPAGYVVIRRTPEFTQDTVPPALLSAHETKGGAWALIHVLEGKLRYCIEASGIDKLLR